VQSLLDYDGNKVKTAETLGMSRATIYRKIHEYGIVTPASRPAARHLSSPLVFADKAAENGSAFDPFTRKAGDGIAGPGRPELAAAMGPSSAVAGSELGQDAAQVSFAEDQHTVGGLGPGDKHEPLGVGVHGARAMGAATR
jgi:hypothetical protein